MNLTQLSNEETENLQTKVIPIERILYDDKVRKNKKAKKIAAEYIQLLTMWLFSQNIDCNSKREIIINKFQELIGFKYNFTMLYEFNNAIWGLKWEKYNLNFIVYLSKKGLSFEVGEYITMNVLIEFCKEMSEMIINIENIKKEEMLKETFEDIL